MQVIQHTDPTGQAIVARVPPEGSLAVQLGSQLVVEETQRVVFLRSGKALDMFEPGRHSLVTGNLPLLTRLLGVPFEGKSPFQAVATFVSMKTFTDLKWGTREPVVYRDRELDMVRLRAFGKFAMRVEDPAVFVQEIVGTKGLFETGEIESYFKDVIVARLTDHLGETLQTIFDLPATYDELGAALRDRVQPDFDKFGLQIVDLFVGAITPPEEVQKRIDERGGMAAVGDPDAYLKFKAAKALGDAAERGGEGAGAVGAGMGAGIGMMMPQMMRESMGKQGGDGEPAASPEAPAAFCSACGEQLATGARFCSACGAAVSG